MPLKNFEIRTDFADEWILNHQEDDSFTHHIMQKEGIDLHFIQILKEENSLHKQKGIYVTLAYEKMDDREARLKIASTLQFCIRELLEKMKVTPHKFLVVGLGNRMVASDALGPLVANEIMVTAHFYKDGNFDMKGTQEVAAIVPGVMGQTGIESGEIVKSIVDTYGPELVIVVDALATGSTARINRVIQLNSVGIIPGSGVGNHRMKLDEETLGVPVLSLGVATVISVAAIVKECVPQLDFKQLQEAHPFFHLVVTPKSIDVEMKQLCEILALALNRFLHPDFDKL